MTDAPLIATPSFDPSETYALTASAALVRGSDSAHIPADPGNTDYRAYLAWTAAGNAATPYVAPALVHSCQLWQLQAVLTVAQWTQVQAAVVALNNPAVSAYYAHGTNPITSDSTTLLALATAIGLTAAQAVMLIQQAALVQIP